MTALIAVSESVAPIVSEQDLVDAQFADIIAANWPAPSQRPSSRIGCGPQPELCHDAEGPREQRQPSRSEVPAVLGLSGRQRSPPLGRPN